MSILNPHLNDREKIVVKSRFIVLKMTTQITWTQKKPDIEKCAMWPRN